MTWIVGGGQQLELEARGRAGARVRAARRAARARGADGGRRGSRALTALAAAAPRPPAELMRAACYAGAPGPLASRRAPAADHRPRPHSTYDSNSYTIKHAIARLHSTGM